MNKKLFRVILLVIVAASLTRVALADSPAAVPLEPALRERCLTVLREGLASEEFWPAMHAAEGLTVAGEGKEVLAALKKRSEADDQKRCGLAREAVRAGDRKKIAVLLEILSTPGSNGHTHAAESLFKVAEVGDGKLLGTAMAQNDDLRLKLMASAALARSGHLAALDVAREHLTHEDREIRKIGAWILGQLGSAADVPRLAKALEKEDEPLARAYFVHALALLGDADRRAALGKNLDSKDAAIRTYAADFAGYCRAVEHRDKLIDLLDDPVLDVRVRSATSLLALASQKGR